MEEQPGASASSRELLDGAAGEAEPHVEAAAPPEVAKTSSPLTIDVGTGGQGSPREHLLIEKHKEYIKNLDKDTQSFEYVASEHLRMNGAYWGLCAMDLMHALGEMDADRIVGFVMSCQKENGGFGPNVDHDDHILSTLSAVQILALFDRLDALDAERVADYITGLQQPDGSFAGDEWGEIDTRFSYCAISCLSLLGRLHRIDVDAAIEFIARCKNFDGGFGATPGGESHAGQIFTCVAALKIAGGLVHVDPNLLGWWLCERQTKGGGLNGRPEKLPDVCYSWWVLSSLIILEREHWLDKGALQHFILESQDEERGGISDRPEDMVDVFHTFFGIGGLSLLRYPGLKLIDAAYALPVDVVRRTLRRNQGHQPEAAP